MMVAVRMGVSATEAGNTYEQFVRAWRLADFVVAHVLGEKERVSWISFQHRDTRPWDDIVEQLPGERGLRAWQVKSLTRPLSDAAVSELLVALREHPEIEEGILAVSHALASPAGLDLMVVEGLCDAARRTNGHLERFRIRDPSEERCLDRLATLMKAERNEVFAALRRFRVTVLHGKPDVVQATERALRPVFERPEELGQALLAFVADHGAPGVEIHFDVLAHEVLSRFSRRTTPWAPPPPAESPDDEVLLWMCDRRGVARTLWLCDRERGSVVADIPELLLGTHDTLLRWDRYPVLVPVLQNSPFADDDEDEDDRIVLETKHAARLTDLRTKATLPLITLVVASDEGFYAIDQSVEILGTFDHVLLARVALDEWTGGAHGSTRTDFVVLDLRRGQRFSLWAEEEARQYVESHRAEAIVQFWRDFERLEGGTEPKLSLCDPYYGQSYELQTRLQLSFDVCGALRDGTWDGGDDGGDYYASTVVESELVPATLAHARKAPAVLQRYWDVHPMDGRCGWTRVPKVQEARELLEKIAEPYATKRGAT